MSGEAILLTQAKQFCLAKQYCFLDADCLVVGESQGTSRCSGEKYPVKHRARTVTVKPLIHTDAGTM